MIPHSRLRFSNLQAARGVVRTLNGSLAAGEALWLQGPNGSGKTTLLKTMVGLMAPASGEVWTPPEGLAYLGHENAMSEHDTVGQHLAWFAKMHRCTPQLSTCLKGLDAWGLPDVAQKSCGTLSFGQKRKVALMRLMMLPYPLWVMDEPLTGLDVSAVVGLEERLCNALAQGVALLYTSHTPLRLTGHTTHSLMLREEGA